MNVTVNGTVPLVGAARNAATGGGTLFVLPVEPIVIRLACTFVPEPPGPLTTNWTVSVPAAVYWYTTLVAVVFVILPSPNCHDATGDAAGGRSVNVTVKGAVPLVGVAPNKAKGGDGAALFVLYSQAPMSHGPEAGRGLPSLSVFSPGKFRLLRLTPAPIAGEPDSKW